MLNIVRYNLGGGSDPNLKQNFRLGVYNIKLI